MSQLGLSPVLFCGDEAGGEQQERNTPLPSVTEETPEQVVASLCASLEDSVASLSATSEEVVDGLPAQRHCVIEKGPLGFGLDFDSVQHTSGTVVSQVLKITHIVFNNSYFCIFPWYSGTVGVVNLPMLIYVDCIIWDCSGL